MVGEEVFVWSEDWQFDLLNRRERDAACDQVMCKTICNTCRWRLKHAPEFYNLWPNGQETDESSFLKLDDVLAVCCSSFREDDQRVHVLVQHYFFLTFRNLLDHKVFVFLTFPV